MIAILQALIAPLWQVIVDALRGPRVTKVEDAKPVLDSLAKPRVSDIAAKFRRTVLAGFVCLALSGCATKVEIMYARATRLPEEATGFMRLAEDSVRVNVVGTTATAEVDGVAGYILIHEADLAVLVEAAEHGK